jgi:hypothetical protein
MQGKHTISERLFGALLSLYPTEFRTAYEQQMRLTFRGGLSPGWRGRHAGAVAADAARPVQICA